MNLAEYPAVDHILSDNEERQLVKDIVADGIIVPRGIVPSLVDVFSPDENGVTYARGVVYWDNENGLSGMCSIVGKMSGSGVWTWAWIEDAAGNIIEDDECLPPGAHLRVFSGEQKEIVAIESF